MTREQARDAAAVMLAWADGKDIQSVSRLTQKKFIGDHWVRVQDPVWDWLNSNYRIKPEPKLRPWTADEVPLGAWMRMKDNPLNPGYMFLIVNTMDNRSRKSWLSECEHSTDGGKTWLPCGVEEAK